MRCQMPHFTIVAVFSAWLRYAPTKVLGKTALNPSTLNLRAVSPPRTVEGEKRQMREGKIRTAVSIILGPSHLGLASALIRIHDDSKHLNSTRVTVQLMKGQCSLSYEKVNFI